ncbi:MarR family winged helix-turn-helix transcriptional regulator [Pseudobacteriovorax antillogorgiicola]|uniref:Transcriptional regulator, MarR family n=1 Tax=Pseudobacteriovorax antillogorgiicola TaxID=1513793 RepID=A0A1Y6B842_9BACT|nr:MarR family transcriptional regulator [Pseudobacteriovorax antillogorgiicola]TCS58649.1 MarR family transcriptional regulator [Pseudobacteriovorax antillogorgiicola]SME96410.1 transcriptional regulator, MarR family [Pseudobacteriovorax antillogorgiicola]
MVPDTLNEDLFFNLDRATLLMRRHVLDAIGFHQVSPEQWEILQLIDNQSGISQSKLSQLTLKDKGNVSRILTRMLKNGWVHREPHRSGRGFLVCLTNEGRRIKNRLPFLVEQQVKRLLGPLPKEEQSEMLYCLKKLRILLGDEDVVASS